ncbi:hypothetical protein ABEW05_000467 [Botrytis cinerea]
MQISYFGMSDCKLGPQIRNVPWWSYLFLGPFKTKYTLMAEEIGLSKVSNDQLLMASLLLVREKIPKFSRLTQPCVQGHATATASATAAILRNGSPASSSLATCKLFSTLYYRYYRQPPYRAYTNPAYGAWSL